MAGSDESMKDAVEWADEMDETRRRHGNNQPHEGRAARTHKHFILSPDPNDHIDLPVLRELAGAWAMSFFGYYQVAIVYHDDNAGNIPHAHLVVNCTNLVTGNRFHTDNPFELNRVLQDMARERGLTGFSNEMKSAKAKRIAGNEERFDQEPRSLQKTYMSRPERGLADSGAYSWLGDIRSGVAITKGLARNETEFRRILKTLEVNIDDNSPKAKRQDWIISLEEDPKCKVTGGRLGFVYGKEALLDSFENKATYHPDGSSSREMLKAAKNAVILSDLAELNHLAATLETCSKCGIRSQAECITYIRAMEGRLERKGGGSASDQKMLDTLRQAHAFITERNLLPKTEATAGTTTKQVSGKVDKEKKAVSQQQKPRHERTRDDRGKGGHADGDPHSVQGWPSGPL